MSDATVRGRFVWHELMTTDVKGAGAFYTKVTGWKTQAWDKDSSYTLFTSAGRGIAGLTLLGDEAKAMGAPPNWLAYIGTENVDETAREAVALGAKLLTPATDIPGTGRFAVLQDPQNAVFAVFTPAPSSASDSAPVVEPFSWHELATTDAPAAVSFYRRLFGWEETDSMDMGADGKYQMFGLKKGSSVGGVFRPRQMPGPPAWTSYIKVADSKKAAAVTTRSGGRVLNGPMEVPGGDLIVQGMDPQGAVFAVHSAKPSAASAKPAAAKEPARAEPAKAKAAAPTRAKAKSAKKKAAKSTPAKRSAAAKAKRPGKKAKTAPKRNARGKKKAGSKKRRR